jgi:hypothetical protein
MTMTWEAVLRARASGHGAEADAARLALAELTRLRAIEDAVRVVYAEDSEAAWQKLTDSLVGTKR